VPVPSGANGVVETVGIEPTNLPVAGRTLCQPSYVPLVEPVGLEPTPSCLPGRCPVRPRPQAGPESRNRTSLASGGGVTDRLASQRPRDGGPRSVELRPPGVQPGALTPEFEVPRHDGRSRTHSGRGWSPARHHASSAWGDRRGSNPRARGHGPVLCPLSYDHHGPQRRTRTSDTGRIRPVL
jgi:hypothetical protein